METKNTCSNEHGILHDRYELIKSIGEGGSSEVYIVKDLTDNNKEYALKLFKKSKYFENEVKMNKIISEMKNSSFIKYITSSVGYLLKKGEKTLYPYIIFEFAKNGDIMNFIKKEELVFTERQCKFIFAKILSIVKALHKKDICHRDLKLDNFLFDENFVIKLCDFGFSTKIPKDKNGKTLFLTAKLGTRHYAAPEILAGKKYDGKKVDIFSLGVILFTLRLNKFGFATAEIPKNTFNQEKQLYEYIKEKNDKVYWEKIGNIEGLSEEFKTLYLKMVAYNPKERPTIEEIYNDEWMKEIRDLDDTEFQKCEEELNKMLKSL
jgi:serine/threonine protein kinase